MDKLKMHSLNKVDENIEKIGKLFPNCLTERIVGYKEEVRSDGTREPIMETAIDFDMLRQELSSVIVDGNEERYQFTWPDKKKSILLANAPIAETLRPCREESVDFDNTENLYIEGDNLDVLKLLQETYLGKIKMIYIDPPYNTGSDFVYEDDFAESADEYLANSGQFDAEGNRLVQNTESNGRFHTDWLNMIYPRLKLAKDLLADDGVIFISIDDRELNNIIKCCNEVFSESNHIATVVREAIKGGSLSKNIRVVHDYLLCYAKSINSISFGGIETEGITLCFEDEQGKYAKGRELNKWGAGSRREDAPSLFYPIPGPNGEDVYPIRNDGSEGRWRLGKQKMFELLKNGNAIFEARSDGTYIVYEKLRDDSPRVKQFTTWFSQDYTNAKGTEELKKLFNTERAYFDYAKPVDLIVSLLKMVNSKDCIILDFFSGSATTAHAVMQLNAEDGGHRKFIMVQLPEETDEKSEAYKAGYKNICEIGKERIRRAGKKIKAGWPTKIDVDKNKLMQRTVNEDGTFLDKYALKTAPGKTQQDLADLDVGFRVLKLDSSNMKDVYYNPAELTMDTLFGTADNIKEDRTPEDLLFQVMLDLGVLLSSKIEESTVAGKKVFNVADGFLIACFDAGITDETITAIAKKKPYYFVMRDSSMASDSVATNFEQIFATYSPDTVRKVL